MPKMDKNKAKSVAEAESSFPLIPEGVWPAMLKGVESKETRAGDSTYWRWEYEVHYEDDKGVDRTGKQWDNTSLKDEAEWRLKQVFEAYGVPSDTDTDDLVGKWVTLQINQAPIGAGSRKGEQGNNIVKVLPNDPELSGVTNDGGSPAEVPDFDE